MQQDPLIGFDPYHKWLGIPESEQPPNHYRLLGIELFEEDPDVIQAAADRQMTHVKSFVTGRYSDHSQLVLNELSKARVCLLNAKTKLIYDKRLAKEQIKQLESTQPLVQAAPATPQAVAEPEAETPPTLEPQFTGGIKPIATKPIRKKKKKKGSNATMLFVGFAAGLVLVALIVANQMGAFNSPTASSPQPPVETVPETEPEETGTENENRDPPPAEQGSSTAVPPVTSTEPPARPSPFETTPTTPTPPSGFPRNDFSGSPPTRPVAPPETSEEEQGPPPSTDIFSDPVEEPSPESGPSVFQGMPRAVSLPPLPAYRPGEKRGISTVSLGRLSPSTFDDLEIDLQQSLSHQLHGFEFVVREAPANAEKSWMIGAVPYTDSDSSKATTDGKSSILPVARIRLKDGELLFDLAASKFPQTAKQVCNVILQFAAHGQNHSLCLRETEATSSMVLDLNDATQTYTAKCENFPDVRTLAVVVRYGGVREGTFTSDPRSGIAYFRDDVTFTYSSLDERINCEAKLSGSQYDVKLIFRTRCRWSTSWSALTLENAEDRIPGLQKALAIQQNKLAQAQQVARALPSQIRSAEAAARNDRSNPALVGRVHSLTSQLTTAMRQVKRGPQNIAQIQQDIPVAQQLISATKLLHNTTEFHFAIIGLTDGEPLVLQKAGEIGEDVILANDYSRGKEAIFKELSATE